MIFVGDSSQRQKIGERLWILEVFDVQVYLFGTENIASLAEWGIPLPSHAIIDAPSW